MVQPSDFGNRHDRAHLGPLDGSHVGRILLEREVSAGPVVVREVACRDAPQVPFAQNENMIQALAPNRADEPLREGILPRAVGCREDLRDAHALYTMPELLAVDAVAIAEEIGRPVSFGKASTICWAVQCALGCSVTLKWTTRRRS
jgi:hypothetical protein